MIIGIMKNTTATQLKINLALLFTCPSKLTPLILYALNMQNPENNIKTIQIALVK